MTETIEKRGADYVIVSTRTTDLSRILQRLSFIQDADTTERALLRQIAAVAQERAKSPRTDSKSLFARGAV